MIKRKGIIVYFRHKKIVNKIKEMGINVTYISDALRYLTGYVDEDKYDEVYNSLKNHRLVKKIEPSKQEMEALNFTI
ncbi:MAG: DUF2129 domain-containing protein [Candidatus Izemoplasmatales bacterium]|nr:DUF2129 domain-containing protein [Candidatus Izemoplasmatales bacterium]